MDPEPELAVERMGTELGRLPDFSLVNIFTFY
jgi:hypothetical protein